ncbi:golgin subfamily B member 1 isoform X3 [Tenrec ecaudatus]|uniref:golgin subfamily B member 1 isoform X3 n=1 Tax=Tenrec ecaudatus TaxID=94439 RepID=UPI003F596D72
MEDNHQLQEDVLVRLSYSEQLVAELKDVIRQKDTELQQKDETLQEERKAADNKIKRMKLHTKAKLISLNKQLEEMKAQGPGMVMPTGHQSEEQLSEEELGIEKIKHILQEKEELISNLQAQLIQAKAEEAAQFDKNRTEMEEFVKMKQQLKEKEELTRALQAQLSQTQAEQAAQLSSMQQVVREKDARFETQVRLHEDELLQLVTQADAETQMQQNLRMLQRKLEEHEEALSGRAQVVDFLQQEQRAAEQRNQVLFQQLQQMETEHNTLKNTLETERQESKILMEKMELEVAEKKLALHSLQEEVHLLLEQREHTGQAHAELESRFRALEQKHHVEIEEKTAHILSLQKTEQDLQSSCDALKDQNSKLLQEKSEQSVQSAQAIQQLEDQLHEKSKEISQFLNKPTLQRNETASQTSFPDAYNEGMQTVTEENIASLQKRVVELENEKEVLRLSCIEFEQLKAENEKLSSQITFTEAQNRSGKTEVSQISTVDNTRLNESNCSTEENGQEVPENTFSQKHKELSVLLLEMKEAQEEIAFLKLQLQGKRTEEGDLEDLGQKVMKQIENEGIPPVEMKTLHEDTGQDFPLMSNAVAKEKQASTTQQNRTSEDLSFNDTGVDTCMVPDMSQCQDELKRLKSQNLELEINLHKAEEIYERNLDENAKEISRLTQLIEEFKKNAENTSSALTALSEERDQLLSQLQELSVLTELRAQVQQLKANLAEAENQRRLDHESQTTYHSLLTEQIQSLSVEATAKDVKIEALQNELDHQQLRFSGQIESLQSQLQQKEMEVLGGEERWRGVLDKMEGLSHALSQKELEITRLDQLLLEKKKDVEALQQTIKEKEEQVTEISINMTEKMVQLNEEKFSLGVEIKTLKEQLNLLSKAEEAKKEQVEDKDVVSGLNNYDEMSPAGLRSKEELQRELDLLKKESELRKRKLHAALINRKELLQRVSRLEEELARVREESKIEVPFNSNENRELGDDKEDQEKSEKCVISKCQELEMRLKQSISEKEAELEHVRKDLEEKVAAEEQLQATVKQMNQTLQDKTNLIDLLQAQITENQIIIQELTTGNKDAGDGDCTAPVRETAATSPSGGGSGEQWAPGLEAKMLGLEKAKRQLEKKLQEVLVSRKKILTKAQEELKQQKEDYDHLQEQFDKQSKEKEDIGDQLRQLQTQVQESLDRKMPPSTARGESRSSAQGSDSPLVTGTEQRLAQPVSELCLGLGLTSQPEDASALQSSTSVDQRTAQMREIETEKEVLELKFSAVTTELSKKSDEVFQLQEQIKNQDLKIQSLETATSEAEAHAENLKLTLESSQLEIVRLEHLRELQPALDESRRCISKKEEEICYLSGQLSEKEEVFTKLKAEMMEQEKSLKALHTQLEMQTEERDEKIKELQGELGEMKQKLDSEKEDKTSQLQRKLQAALISRKRALQELKDLQEELSLARESIGCLTKSLADRECQISAQNKEKDTFSEKLTLLQEERDKLIAEVDKSLLENQSLNGSCESLKLALEGLTGDKENLMKEMESLKRSQIAENTEWQEKHKELQKEYEMLLQSYENVSNEAERIQHVVEAVRQEKQELYGKLRNTEMNKKEIEKQLQEAEQEKEEMKDKMRKFAKSKQQKIVELEEENDRLRAEAHPIGDTSNDRIEELLSSNSSLKEELEKITMEYKTLSKKCEALMAEKDILSQEVQDLKHQVEDNVCKQVSLEATEKQDNQMDTIVEPAQSVSGEAEEPDSLSTSTRPEYSQSILSNSSTKIDPDISEKVSPRDEVNDYLKQIDQIKERMAELEKEKQKEKEFSQALENERDALLNQVLSKDGELTILQEEVTKINLLNQQIQEELSRVTKLKEATEEEKDDLEERLMNQLAELNGSIGNYYQDVTDAQIKNEQLESEMQNLKKCVSELEEEKQQLVKEKTKVESEIRKEYMEKIQGAQREPGNKSHAQELKELLKEKQQEVKQLQKDCIRYQEKISALERTVKALEFVQSESQKDLEKNKENLVHADELRGKAQAELASFRVLLDDTQSEAARVLADNLQLKKELQSHKDLVKRQMKQKDDDLERKLEQAENKHLKEMKNMQEKLDVLHREKVHLEETFGEIQVILNKKDTEVKQLQENLDRTVAQLAAFTKSMSSLQDDRDRVIDEAKTWERKFSEAIQTKQDELRLKEENCSALKDQLRQMSIHMEELKINISRLDHDKQAWECKAQTEVQLQQKVCDTLQGENKELLAELEETRNLYNNSQTELAKLESELKILRDQSIDLNNSLEKCKEHKEHLERLVKQQETDIQHCKFRYEQLETDLQASKELTNRLHEEINMKEQKIINLLSAKEEAIQLAISEQYQQHDKDIKQLESQLSQKEEENRNIVDKNNQLMETLNTIKKEGIQQKAQLDSFVKSMSSLQDDRDRVVDDYHQLEERHLSIILEKDQLIQDAATENNKLKEEMRCLRSHMDDLNSENAKLDAELIQYREDLNQVISIKDCQQKQLLETQLQQNKELKSAYAKLEEKLKEAEEAEEALQRSCNALQVEKQGLAKETDSLKIFISKLKGEVAALQEEGTLGKVQVQLKVKEEEVQKLSTTLSSSQERVTELEKELVRVQKEATKKVDEIEDKLKKELKYLHHDAGIMRNETETAEERVAELARDLMEMEQKFLMATKENNALTAQIQSFGRSMSSLQDSRDQATEELDELKRKYDSSLKEMAQLREKQGLLSREKTLCTTTLPKSSTEDSSLSPLEKLNQQRLSKDEQLFHLSAQLEESYSQLQSFSKAMASLQRERDDLLSELARFRKSEGGKQWSAAHPVSSPAEVQSFRNAMSSLQNDRDRLLKELKNLQQQYLQINQEITELRPLKAQVQDDQDKMKAFQRMQEEYRQETLSWQHELQQLRMEKSSWEIHEKNMKEQYLMAISDKDQQLSHLQNLLRELKAASSQALNLKEQYQREASSEASISQDGSQSLVYETELLKTQLNDSLREIHQKELRIQQLNSKFSQLLEEKNTLSIQLCDTSQSLRENQQLYRELFNHCAVLENQAQERPVNMDTTPGAPQDMNRGHRQSPPQEPVESRLRLSEVQQELHNTKQEVSELRKLLEEERDQRVAAESTLSEAEEQIKRLDHSEWDSERTPIIGSCGSEEQSVIIDLTSSTCRRPRSGVSWRRILRSLCHSRTRVPLLAALYFLMVHVLLILCFTGHF